MYSKSIYQLYSLFHEIPFERLYTEEVYGFIEIHSF